MEGPSWLVGAGQDREGTPRDLGVSTITFKVLGRESNGAFFVLEQASRAPGGPPKHLHYEQDEWFYVIEGEYVIEIGDERRRLGPGDSAFAPRKIPHVWAFAGERSGRMLIALTPAGQIEAFLDEVGKLGRMAPEQPALFRKHGMELVGPPLPLR